MPKKIKICDHSCFMCRYMISDWKELVSVRRDVIKIRKGARFIEEGEPALGVYFVQKGLVKVHKQWGEKENIVRFAKKGDVVGHRGLADEPTVFPISATALDNSELCFIPMEFFKSLLKANPVLMYELLMFYAEELQASEQKTTNQIQLSVKGRLAWSLLRLEQTLGIDPSGYIDASLSKSDLAAYIGTSYESAHRMFSELIQEKVIVAKGRFIKIADHRLLLQCSQS